MESSKGVEENADIAVDKELLMNWNVKVKRGWLGRHSQAQAIPQAEMKTPLRHVAGLREQDEN